MFRISSRDVRPATEPSPNVGPDAVYAKTSPPRVTVNRIVEPKDGAERSNISSTGWNSNGESPRASGVSLSKPSRLMRKLHVYREEFHVGNDELFLEDYLCAVQKKTLKQGRMYIFDKHIGFHANIFGHHKYYSIPIKDITKVTKESNVGFPNSVKICWGHTHSLFFTSFLNREDAYNRAPSEAGSPEGSEDEALTSITKPVKKLLCSVGLSRSSATSQGGGKSERSPIREDSSGDSDSDSSGSSDDESSVAEGGDPKAESLDVARADEDAPSVQDDAKPSLEYTVPCSPQVFWTKFLGNNSSYFKDFHESRGDSSVKLTKWKKHSKGGVVRDLQFVTPVKMKMGPDTTLCNQTQRFTAYRDDHLVFETTQTMNDIPYSDHFTVDSRWDVTSSEDDKCTVRIYIFVPFSKAKDVLAGKKGTPAPKTQKSRSGGGASGLLSGSLVNTALLAALVVLQLLILWHLRSSTADPRSEIGAEGLRPVLRELILELKEMRLQDTGAGTTVVLGRAA
ncbi:hypothetical protein APUTEX25_004675 [Auxenochlorella protothecoides]|uniref:VASt domain-containing protein n=1 Tax=Auxenochlorella protothecoides TaxID=3075 RepID=A0A3M7L4I2_AUXPR|nr:hypothetical protein APUTEX25_004675 [Auxenochlorella protothecoides]|eukprot:RMZ56452.1 hypothetical protein APUTEX25_004675 [Auxenochlorella protothecoides]